MKYYDGTRAAMDTRRVAADVSDALTRAWWELGQQADTLSTTERVQAAALRDLLAGTLEDLGVDLEEAP